MVLQQFKLYGKSMSRHEMKLSLIFTPLISFQ